MSDTPYRPWMHSLLDRMKELYGKADAKTISEALPDGNFFKIKGSVANYDNLPTTGNEVGDIYIVSSDGSEHIWVTSTAHPNGYWEKLGNGISNPDPVIIWPTIVDHESEDGVSLSGYYDQDETPVLNVGGSIDGESARITGLRAPSGDYDAANKKYVDDTIAASSSVLYVNLTNMVGVLTADKTYAEILAAYQAGKVVVVMYLHMAFYLSEEQSDNYAYLLFDHVQLGGDGGIIDELVVNFADEWSTAHISFDRGIVHTTIVGATPTITPEDNNYYHCGTLTSLTLNNPSSAEKYSILFISGSTPTVVTGIDNFIVEANKRYKINVEYGYATFDSWPVSGV